MDTKETYDASKFEKPSVTVDVLFFTIKEGMLQVLLIKRAAWPYDSKWALPGGFVRMNESLDEAAQREICEECGVKNLYLEQLYTFGDPKRDPRTRVITVAYYALAPSTEIKEVQEEEVREAKYFSINDLPKLAFDHKVIIEKGFERLKSKLGYSNIVFGLLPKTFPLSEVQKIYEIIYGRSIDKRNFRKWILSSGLVVSTDKKSAGLAHRPALLYRFVKNEVVTFK
ncbi:MAG TPA: NUDIX domain-containing protein [Spirochaetia bacterium]|nr:NUDIX domain-containing protein [Spirochaetia bacterium]